LLPFEKTANYPWFADYERSSVKYDKVTKTGSVTCTMGRDLVTDYANIDLKGGVELVWHSGYRVYFNKDSKQPIAKGFKQDMKLVVADGAVSALATVFTSMVLTAALMTF